MTQIPIISPKLPLDTICGDLEGPEFKRLKSILGRDPWTFLPSAKNVSGSNHGQSDGVWIPELRIIKRVGK